MSAKKDTSEASASQRMTRQKTRRAGDSAEDKSQAAVDRMNYTPHRVATRSAQARAAQMYCAPAYATRQRGRFRDEERREWTEPESSSAFTNAARRNPDEEKENTDTSRDPSTDNGESSGNSLEAQQWSDTEGNNRPASTQTAELEGDGQTEVPCRVTWCEHAGKRFGLCWAHGGVKKCCHRNCPKIALATGEFCSIHEREVNAGAY